MSSGGRVFDLSWRTIVRKVDGGIKATDGRLNQNDRAR